MTTPPRTITCKFFGDALADFMEGAQDAGTRAAMEAHARSCRACGDLLADLRKITARAGALADLVPSWDLWPGIAGRIDAAVTPLVVRRKTWKVRALTIGAIAATFVLAAVLGYESTHRDAPAPAVAARARRPPAARLAAATPSAVEASYTAEIAGLRAAIEAKRSQLDPATVATVERNLRIVDQAIAACEAALAHDPASRFLIQSLDQSLGTKVQLMRRIATLPPGA